ncbi:hypothetical protein ACFE04_003218 [Oxalis oulophora]
MAPRKKKGSSGSNRSTPTSSPVPSSAVSDPSTLPSSGRAKRESTRLATALSAELAEKHPSRKKPKKQQPPTPPTPVAAADAEEEEEEQQTVTVKKEVEEEVTETVKEDEETEDDGKVTENVNEETDVKEGEEKAVSVKGKEKMTGYEDVKVGNMSLDDVAKAKNETTGGLGPFGGDVSEEEKDNDRAIVVEHCTQCNSFKTRAAQVKEGLENAVPGITVVLNPKKPRKGCFEIREEGGEKFITLLDLKRPFKPMKDLDMEKVISDIVEKLK